MPISKVKDKSNVKDAVAKGDVMDIISVLFKVTLSLWLFL